MSRAAFGLGIDFGTSNTVAMLRWPDGRIKPLLFEASPLLPSAVFGPPEGGLVVGSDALHHARFNPACLEPNPKRHIHEEMVLLGDREVAVATLVTAVLRHVANEAVRVAGGAMPAVALAHPAGWGPTRRQVLVDAASAAGLGTPQLVPEPTAAANYFTQALARDVGIGKALVVYDLGAGTFDASVVVRRAAGFEVAAVDGISTIGGLDIDASIVDWLRERYSSKNPDAWDTIINGLQPDACRQRKSLWDDARVAKEMLSRAPAVIMQMAPPIDVEAQLTRSEFEAVAEPLVRPTVRTTKALINTARLKPGDIAGVLLTGGGSRIPHVATLLHRALDIAPTVPEQPELVVSEGTLQSIRTTGAISPTVTAANPRPSHGNIYHSGQFATIKPRAADTSPRHDPTSRVIPLWTVEPHEAARTPSHSVGDSRVAPAERAERTRPTPRTTSPTGRRRHRRRWAAVVIALTIPALAYTIGFKAVPYLSHQGTTATVPQLVNEPTDHAGELLAAQGLKGNPTEDAGAGCTLGRVTAQNTPPGKRVNRGSEIGYSICVVGHTQLKVPNVIGMSQTDAFDVLTNAKLKVSATRVDSDQPADTVVATIPPTDALVDEGSSVTIQLAQHRATAGPNQNDTATLPDLTGKSVDQAKRALRDAGFTTPPKVINTSTTDQTRVDKIVSQDHEPNRPYRKDTLITIYVGVAEPPPSRPSCASPIPGTNLCISSPRP